ncbi:nicotinamide riboside transporter PnuC [Sphingobacterium suaedae]|uniref:Nicotinamide riboside transporter PnuC n=1 Tax=Sphingobacterium suaedae TaxID=1686402 RepID=A0ABW5KIV6_9SPHI
MPEFFTSLFHQLIHTSALEWTATITGFLCVYLAARQHVLNWPISIISVSIYTFIFVENKLYGDALLQLYFLGTAIYGWFYWNKVSTSDYKPIILLSNQELIRITLLIVFFTVLLGQLLDKFTDTDVPHIDAFCTVTSFVAQYLMTRKILQNWLLWIIVNLCYIPLYIHKDLILTAVLYMAFVIIAWNGYQFWKKAFHKNNENIDA